MYMLQLTGLEFCEYLKKMEIVVLYALLARLFPEDLHVIVASRNIVQSNIDYFLILHIESLIFSIILFTS